MVIRSILCPVDFSQFSTTAYHHALSLADHYDARLVVLHVVELWRYPYADYAASSGDYANFQRALGEDGRKKLHLFVKSHPHHQVHLELAVCEGRAPDSILSFAEKQKIDVIVMGTHGRRGFDRLVLGSATDRVMRQASCPVLAVNKPTHDSIATAKGEHHVHHLSRILMCTDFSENSEQALEYAFSVTEEYNAELTVLHVVDEVRKPGHQDKMVAAAREELDKLILAKKPKSLRISTAVHIGKPYQRIIEDAERASTDLIAMGVRGIGTVDRAVFGSTTYRVIQLGPCPVLAVHV